jgi:predicted transcriptional regulator
MSGRRSFKELKGGIDAEPSRRARVEEAKRAMRDALALAELRASRDLTQVHLARALGVSQPNVSRIEHQEDVYLSTLRSYVQALGGQLEIRAVFDDEVVDLEP